MKRLLFFSLLAAGFLLLRSTPRSTAPNRAKLICLIPNGLNFTQSSFASLGFLSEAGGKRSKQSAAGFTSLRHYLQE